MFCQDTLVGVDSAGNRYYKRGGRRFVRYATGECDPTKIAVEWHLWLHHAVDSVPDDSSSVFAEVSRPSELGGSSSAGGRIENLHYVPWRPE